MQRCDDAPWLKRQFTDLNKKQFRSLLLLSKHYLSIDETPRIMSRTPPIQSIFKSNTSLVHGWPCPPSLNRPSLWFPSPSSSSTFLVDRHFVKFLQSLLSRRGGWGSFKGKLKTFDPKLIAVQKWDCEEHSKDDVELSALRRSLGGQVSQLTYKFTRSSGWRT